MEDVSKNIENASLWHAKILLFGEYSVILGSMALTVPFGHFTAGFGFLNMTRYTDHNKAVRSNGLLREYLDWLSDSGGGFSGMIDTGAFSRDLERGLFLESNIPQGYGIGSSGAVVAAVYDRYATNRIDNAPDASADSLRELKSIFGAMESFFHGTSSGLDPLNCYIGRPVLVGPGDKLEITGIPGTESGEGASVFLVDTATTGRTGPLVRQFMERYKEAAFRDSVDGVMIPAVNESISSLLEPDMERFWQSLRNLSGFQLKNMKEMIPSGFELVWERGLVTGDYFMKLCGSGGGGYLLGFTANLRETAAILRRLNLRVIPVYMNPERYG